MIHFEGDRSFSLPIAEVAAKLSDAGFLVHCLPDSEILEATPNKAVWKHRPKISFLTGGLNAELTAIAKEPGKSITFKVLSKAIGASSTVTTALTFQEAEGGGTSVHWVGELVEVTGLLKVVPKGLLQGTAQKVIDDVWTAVTARMMQDAAKK